MSINITFYNEFEIDKATSKKLNQLLQTSFPDVDFQGQDYFKQLPHYRMIAQQGEQIVGQVALDFRAMNLNGQAVKVLGLLDLCVAENCQGQGIGKQLLQAVEDLAKKYKDKIDFLFLVTDTPNYYQRLGYKSTRIATTWLKIDQCKNYGLGKELITDAFFMIKSISGKNWEDGELDLLGYMY